VVANRPMGICPCSEFGLSSSIQCRSRALDIVFTQPPTWGMTCALNVVAGSLTSSVQRVHTSFQRGPPVGSSMSTAPPPAPDPSAGPHSGHGHTPSAATTGCCAGCGHPDTSPALYRRKWKLKATLKENWKQFITCYFQVLSSRRFQHRLFSSGQPAPPCLGSGTAGERGVVEAVRAQWVCPVDRARAQLFRQMTVLSGVILGEVTILMWMISGRALWSNDCIERCGVYAVLVGGANEDLDLLELIDGRSYKLQCRSACRTRQAETCMGEGLLTQRS